MSGFTKLFSSIIASTIWCESPETKVVWITMLAMADQNGVVNASAPGLAAMAQVGFESVIKALQCFEAPDEYSRSTEFEGRRIQKVDGGWLILNYQKYREIRNEEKR